MDKNNEDAPLDLSEDEARAGVTGHNVRYVLAFGLAGVILAFGVVGIYFGYDRLVDMFSQMLARDPITVLQNLTPYGIVVALGALLAVLLLSLWNRAAGRSQDASQTGMRIRVVLQFVIICAAMTFLYMSAS